VAGNRGRTLTVTRMDSSKRRTRLVCFRLDQQEYQDLRERSMAQGARSISDFTRSTLSRLIGNHTGSSREALEAEVYRLSREVERLARLVEGHTPRGLTENGEPTPIS
jgi:hypothetical protein